MGELIFVGLGLAGTQDLTVRALEAVRASGAVFAEFYTSRLVGASLADLERALGMPVRVLDRDAVEQGADELLAAARNQRVAFLTAGDPMTATTHQELRQRALARGLRVRLFHGVSIQTAAAGAAGLHSYKFGRTTTLVLPQPGFNPPSPYEVIRDNKARGLHTLVLLDLRAHEDRYMSASEAARILLEFESERREGVVEAETRLVALARVGAEDETIAYERARDLSTLDLGPPLHTLIVPGELHFSEEEALERIRAGGPQTAARTQRP